ncbi:hypothetical protein Poly30_10740 [Planctomycetes bacterium Poly30]|uniref:DUF7309 domain-containing protein n=1 Tax=Saltatorellus ferox TaxID=2528018 RepID=A0A518ENA6_9BACT|nr:hypothetical protein Poly30_10740 [Planctomycetes bacterium Poly30]
MAKKTPKKDGKDKLFVDLIAAAMAFKSRRLWEHADSDDPISVRLEGEEHPLIVSVLGSAGMEVGVSIIRGPNAMRFFEDVLLAGGAVDPGYECELLSMTFDPRSSLPPEFLSPIEGSGRVFGKDASVPSFVEAALGKKPGPMSRPGIRLVLVVLQALLLASAGGKLIPRRWDWRRRVLELSLEGKGKKAKVHDSVVVWPESGDGESEDAGTESTVASAVLGKRWYDETAAAEPTNCVWGVATLASPGIENDPRDLEVVLARDERTGLMLTPQIVEAGHPEELADAFLELFKAELPDDDHRPGLPKQVNFLQKRPALQLGTALDALGVKFTVDPDQEELVEAVNRLRESFYQREPDSLSDGGPDSIHEWKAADKRLTESLFRAGRITKTTMFKERLLAGFFGDAIEGMELLEHGREHGAIDTYLGWILLRYRARPGAPTVAERLRDQRRLGLLEQTLLEARIEAKAIVGRVVSTDPGASLEIENSLTGERHTVHDLTMSKTASVNDGLIVELFPVKEWTFASLVGPSIPPFAIPQTLQQLESRGIEFEDGCMVGDRSGLGELYLFEVPMPIVRNQDGDVIEPMTLTFKIEPGTDVAALLEELPEVSMNSDGTWAMVQEWETSDPFGTFDAGSSSPGDGLVLAEFEVVADELLAHVDSGKRALAVKEQLGSLRGLRYAHTRSTPTPPPGKRPAGMTPPSDMGLGFSGSGS